MQTLKLTLDKLHPNQQYIKDHLARFNVLNCGRRFGKNILEKDLAITPMLAGYPVGWYEPTYKSLADIWREICATLYPITKDKSEQEKRIELITGGVLDMWSLEDPDASRGRKYKRVVINEAAKIRKLDYSWPNVIRATLADMKGDGVIGSTPKGLNYFHEMWRMSERSTDWARFHYTTYDNPFIEAAEIDSIKSELPERVFQQEIMAEFVEDGSFFQRVDQAAVIKTPDTPDMHRGHHLTGAIDWALSGDFTVIGVACRECNRVVDWDRFNKIDFTYQRERIYQMWDKWQPELAGVLPERNSIGEPNIEIIRSRMTILLGMDGKPGFNTTATTKPIIIQGLAQAIEHDGFQVPAEAASELRSFEVETMASGHPKFSAPEGQHDDWVMMLALLWHSLKTGGVQIFL